MTSPHQSWMDEPIRSKDHDTLHRRHLTEQAAQLISGSHSWEASVVFGLTGPWGSGKTSMVELIIEEIEAGPLEWRVARFTPWATSDATSLLAEFFSALTAALPADRRENARKIFQDFVCIATPWLNLVPVLGSAMKGTAEQLTSRIARQKPWEEAFKKACSTLRDIGTPVLVVADDIDRLQADELVSLLKVVRLLGRFPGVNYLLAYDEQTLLENLQHAGVGVSNADRARLFMEKIVQYPLTVPPLLGYQMRSRLEDGLNRLFADLNRSWDEHDNRIGDLLDVFEAQLNTPRSIDRLLAQLRHYLPLQDEGDVNDTDVILLMFLHLHFPDLYNSLPMWKSALLGVERQLTQMFGHDKDDDPEWDDMLRHVPEGNARQDARRILEVLFPAMRPNFVRSGPAPRVCVADYFDRYFAHTIPQEDISDTEVRSALKHAATVDSDGHLLIELLTQNSHPRRLDLVLKKLRDIYAPEGQKVGVPAVTLNLIRVVASQIPNIADETRILSGPRDQSRYLLADLLTCLPSTHATGLGEALSACADYWERAEVLRIALSGRRTFGASSTFNDLKSIAGDLSDQIAGLLLDHLGKRDDGDLEFPSIAGFSFVKTYGNPSRLRERIRTRLAQEKFNIEDLAARFVTTRRLVGPINPIPGIGGFEQDLFAAYAPPEDELYSLSLEDVDTSDASWANRRAFTHGRAKAPTTSISSSPA